MISHGNQRESPWSHAAELKFRVHDTVNQTGCFLTVAKKLIDLELLIDRSGLSEGDLGGLFSFSGCAMLLF